MNPERPVEDEKNPFSQSRLEEAAVELFGESWKGRLAAALGRDGSTTRRQGYRDVVPGPVRAAVIAWLVLRRGFSILPPDIPDGPFRSAISNLEIEPGGTVDVVTTAELLYGDKWKLRMAEALGIDRTSLWRILASGEAPGPVLAALRAWLLIYRFARIVPPFDLGRFPAPSSFPDELSYRRRPDGSRRSRPKSKYAVLVEGSGAGSEREVSAEEGKVVK